MTQHLPPLLLCLLVTTTIAAAPPASTRPAVPPHNQAWTPEAVQRRLRILEHGTDAERQSAMVGMRVGMVTSEFRRPLLTILRDEWAHIRTRMLAARTLIYHRRFTTDADLEAAVKVLGEALSDQNPEVREDAIEYLRNAGPAQRHAAGAVLRLIEDAPEGELRRELMETVIGDDDGSGVHPELAEALSPGLQKLLHSPDRQVAVTAHAVLRFVDRNAIPSPAPVLKHVPHYVDRLKQDDPAGGPDALVRLYEIGPEAAAAIPEIVRFIVRNRDSDLVQKGGLYVASLPFFFGDAALPELLKLLNDGDDAVVCLAATFIGNARQAYRSAVPALIELTRITKGHKQVCVVKALASVGRDDERVAEVLRGFARDADHTMRRAAVAGLTGQSPSDENLAAVAALTADPHEKVRTAAEFTHMHLEARRRNDAAAAASKARRGGDQSR